MEIRLTGKIAADRIRHMRVPRAPEHLLEAYRQLGEATGIISDVMDKLGMSAVVGASNFKPTIQGRHIVGTALTVRNIMQLGNPFEAARNKVNKMAEFEAHNLAQPGDVIVIQGVSGISNMGGISAQTGKRQGEVGAVVEGGIRDVAHSRAVDYPLWATEITPLTGKWRIETVEINGDVQISGHRVRCGDIVIADGTGVCFIPIERAAEVLELCQIVAEAEEMKCKSIQSGTPVPDLSSNA